jgi:hypothetical protein
MLACTVGGAPVHARLSDSEPCGKSLALDVI